MGKRILGIEIHKGNIALVSEAGDGDGSGYGHGYGSQENWTNLAVDIIDDKEPVLIDHKQNQR